MHRQAGTGSVGTLYLLHQKIQDSLALLTRRPGLHSSQDVQRECAEDASRVAQKTQAGLLRSAKHAMAQRREQFRAFWDNVVTGDIDKTPHEIPKRTGYVCVPPFPWATTYDA